MNTPDTLSRFIHMVSALPYVPSRHVYRLSDYFLKMDVQDMEAFLHEMLTLRNQLTRCSICDGWRQSNDTCAWCGPHRDQSRMCVVESWIDAYALERSKLFTGVYHVLGGALAPLDGITPDLLTFSRCLDRIEKGCFEEILIATNQTPEGEATASYLLRIAQKRTLPENTKFTLLASGVPVGTALEYVDRLTLGKALANRRMFI